GGAQAVDLARKLILDDRIPLCIVAGVDTFLVGPTIAAYVRQHRVLTQSNSNGFIPGEAGCAILIGPSNELAPAEFLCKAVGFGREKAAITTEEPLRADGLVEAFRGLDRDGGMTLNDADYRYTDCNGEQYGFKSDRLAISRVLRRLKARFDHLHPADSIGEIGAAVGPCMLGPAVDAGAGAAGGKKKLRAGGRRVASLQQRRGRRGRDHPAADAEGREQMSNEVYANGREVSCKAAAGKSICAFPDVCFTPPQTPATPPGVPLPYPNTGMATDTSDGSKTVQITGKEVMLKDSSCFKQSTGDEAGCAPKKNIITSKIKGKCYYSAWSMDVKIEGENAVRHLDLMTHNHASSPGGVSVPWPYQDNQSM